MSNPNFTYRAKRTVEQAPTPLEQYGENHIVTFFRYNMEERHKERPDIVNPNHEFGPLIEDAARFNEKIEMFDNNEGLLDQVIFGVQFPDLCHSGVRDIVDDRRLIALLLVRHFKKFGGLVLPPLAPAQELSTKHAQTVRADMAAGRQPAPMHYPNWRQAQMTPPPPGFSNTAGSAATKHPGRGGGAAGRGRGARGGGYGGSQVLFCA